MVVRADSLDAKRGLIVAITILLHADMNKSVTEVRRESTNVLRPEPRRQPHSYMARGHEIKEVAIVGVEGHDVVDRFAGWQLQCPLIGQGHVRQEGQL